MSPLRIATLAEIASVDLLLRHVRRGHFGDDVNDNRDRDPRAGEALREKQNRIDDAIRRSIASGRAAQAVILFAESLVHLRSLRTGVASALRAIENSFPDLEGGRCRSRASLARPGASVKAA